MAFHPVKPAPRATYLTRLSVWPRFGSKIIGILATAVFTSPRSGFFGVLAGCEATVVRAEALCLAAGRLSLADARRFDELLVAAARLPAAFVLVMPFTPASTPTSRTITDKIESDNLPVRCPMIFFIADRSKYAFLNSRSL